MIGKVLYLTAAGGVVLGWMIVTSPAHMPPPTQPIKSIMPTQPHGPPYHGSECYPGAPDSEVCVAPMPVPTPLTTYPPMTPDGTVPPPPLTCLPEATNCQQSIPGIPMLPPVPTMPAPTPNAWDHSQYI